MSQLSNGQAPVKSNIMWTLSSVISSMKKRKVYTEEQAEESEFKRFTVRGDGNWVDVKNGKKEPVAARGTGEVLRKKIFNVIANSDIALRNPDNKALLSTAKQLEAAGKAQEAANYYNAFMNAVEISFSVLASQAIVNTLRNKMQIEANLQLITTDRGKVITIDPSSIMVVKADTTGKSTNLVDYFGEDAPESLDATGAEVVPASELDALQQA